MGVSKVMKVVRTRRSWLVSFYLCVCFVVDSVFVLVFVFAKLLVFVFVSEIVSAGHKRRSWQVLFRRISLQINLWPARKEAGRA